MYLISSSQNLLDYERIMPNVMGEEVYQVVFHQCWHYNRHQVLFEAIQLSILSAALADVAMAISSIKTAVPISDVPTEIEVKRFGSKLPLRDVILTTHSVTRQTVNWKARNRSVIRSVRRDNRLHICLADCSVMSETSVLFLK